MGFGPAKLPVKRIVEAIRSGFTLQKLSGFELLKYIGAENFWELRAFKGCGVDGSGVRFKVKGTRFTGDVIIKELEPYSASTRYYVAFGKVKKGAFAASEGLVFKSVAKEELAPLIEAVVEDPEAEVIEAA
jgi:hypothetical protein